MLNIYIVVDIRQEKGDEIMEKDDIEVMHTRLINAFHRIRRVKISDMMEISQSEFFALQIIFQCQQNNPKREGIYVSELAEKLRIASSQTSRMLRSLEECQLVGRSIDTKDRRNTYVFLTEKGQKEYRRAKARLTAYMDCVWEEMGEERMRELIGLCNELADIMESKLEHQVSETSKTKKKEMRKDGTHGKDIQIFEEI